MANPYTKEDDERLLRYIATYNPERPGRSGNKLYQDLVAQPKKWPWSKRHPWSSWRERYVKKSKEFDKKISDWQKKQGDRPGMLTHLKRSSQQEKPSTSRPAAKIANGASSPNASRTRKATINDNGKRGRSSVGQSNSQTLKRPRLQTISPVQKEAGTIRPAAIKKKPTATTASKGKGKEKAPPVSDSETESESEGPAGPDDYNYKGQVFEKEEEEEEEEHPPQAMETDEGAAEPEAGSQSIWDDIHRASSSPEPVAGSHLVSPIVATHPAPVLEIPVTTVTPSRPIVSTAQTNHPVTPKPDGDEGLQISQEPTPPRSGVSETPQHSPASSRRGRFDVNTPHSEHGAKRMRVTELSGVALEHLHAISIHGSSSPAVETPIKVPPRHRSFFKVRPIEPEDIFETASSNGTPATAPPRKQREPPRLIEGPYVSSFADSSGASRLTAGGRRTNGASGQSDESESEAEQRRPDPNWPPRRGSMKSVTDAKLGGKGVSPKATVAADSTAVSRVSSSSKDRASVQRAPAVPAMKHVLEKGPTRAIFPRPPQVNAEASSSKIKLPGPSKPAVRTASPSDASSTNQPVRFPRVTASKSSAAPTPRPSSLAPAKDPFSKEFIRTDTESDGLAKAAVEKGKVKATLMIERRQTFSGAPAHDGVPHFDLANYVRKREHQRTNGRQSAPLIDLRARRASSAASRSRSSVTSSADRPRRNSSASASSIDHRSRRASSTASEATPSLADVRRLSAAPRDMQLALRETLEGVLQRLAKNHGFDEAVARRIWECKGDFRKTDEALRVMREWAQEGLDQLGDAGEEGDEGDDDGKEEGEDEQEQDAEQDAEAEEEADVAMLVAPSRSASDRSASPAQRAPVIPRTSVSPVRASNGFEYTPRPEPEPEPRPAHYSPPSQTRAGQYVRLERAGRAEEARLREIRRASRGHEIGTRESDAEEGEEAAQEGGDVEMDDDEAEGDGWDAQDAVRELEEQEQRARAREEQEREEREERERAVAEQERLRREMEKAAERRAEKARRAQERRAAAEREQLREAEQRERAESEQRQRLERGRMERARMERERLERAQVERERMERERMERQQREREQEERMERERLEREQRERMERERAQRAQREREEAQRRDREEQPEVAESTADVEPSVEEMDLDRETDIHEERVQSPTHEQYFGDEDSDGDVGEKEDYLPGPPHPSSSLVQESQQSGESHQGRDRMPKPQRTEEDYLTLFNGDATELRALADRVGPRSVKWQIADAYVEMAGN